MRVHPGRYILNHPPYIAKLEVIKSLNPTTWLIPLVSVEEWNLLVGIAENHTLGTLQEHGAEPTSGEIIFNAATRPYMTEDDSYELILRGSHVQRYELAEKAKQGTPEYLKLQKYLENSSRDSKAYAFKNPRIVYQEGSAIDAWRRVVPTFLPEGNVCGHKICYFVNYRIDKFAFLEIFASNFINWLVERFSTTNSLPAYLIGSLPFPKFNIEANKGHNTPRLKELKQLYDNGSHDNLLTLLHNTFAANDIRLVHDALSFLAHQMINLNTQQQSGKNQFLKWMVSKLQVQSNEDKEGIETLSGYTIIQSYLGDYQKGESQLSWDELYFRLHQNRRHFAVKLSQVKGQIQTEYEKSLEILLPIKQQLTETDALIDKIVYHLYGLTDEEIELIERPAYEDALREAKQKVLSDKKLQMDTEAAVDALADDVLRAAGRFQSRINITPEEQQLDQAFPGWRLFNGDVPTFLRTAEWNLNHLPDHMDFTASVIAYTKAVEQAILQRLFLPFRAAGHGPADVRNSFLKKYMERKKKLTLGSFPYILTSKERALAAFADHQYPGRGQTIFFDKTAGVRVLLNDQEAIDLRNAAAHSDVLTRENAEKVRVWALAILRYL